MSLEPFDRIISLGGMCQPAWNIQNCFGAQEAYPFDWWITPGDSLLRLLEDDMRDAFVADNLEIIDDRNTVRCRHYDVLHHHDFPRDDSNKVIADLGPSIADAQQKYEFLWARFLSHCSTGRVLFVRAEGDYLNGWAPAQTWGVELRIALERKFPGLDFDLMLVTEQERRVAGRVIYDAWQAVGEPTGDWRGWPQGWKELFTRWGVRKRG